MKARNILIILIVGILIFFLLIIWMGWQGFKLQKGEILVTTDKKEYIGGGILKVKIKNNFGQNTCFSSCYPYYLQRRNKIWESYKYDECHRFNGNGYCINSGEEKAFELTLPQISEGFYRLAIPVCIGCQSEDTFREDNRFYSNQFTIK